MGHISEELIHTTTRLETSDAAGAQFFATAFLFRFEFDSVSGLAFVTNRHALAGMTRASLHVTLESPDGSPLYGQHERLTILELQERCIYHDDPAVDLALITVSDIIEDRRNRGKTVYMRSIAAAHLPTENEIASFTAIEDILMIGYPSGIWDSTNNLPVVRRGLTATPLARDYEGRKEFLIDAACFPGSSGSPVVLLGGRAMLLGILYAGPQHTIEGQVIIEPVPTTTGPTSVSHIPSHLGYCIKSARILDFIPALRKLTKRQAGLPST